MILRVDPVRGGERTIKMFGLAILTLIAGVSASQSQVYMSHDRGYRGISVHIDNGLRQENCKEIIRKIKDMFSGGSEVLQTATQFTHHPVHFSQVTIVLPEFWSESDCGETVMKPTGNTLYKHADMVITSSGPRHVTQGSTCGEPGHVIHLPVSQLLDARRSKTLGNILVSEWSKYRYGVFSEHGSPGDPLYPNYFHSHGNIYPTGPSNTVLTGSWRFANSSTGCDPTQDLCHYHLEGANSGVTCSLNNVPELETVSGWCSDQETGHHGPSMQAVLCNGRSVRQVISKHHDFASHSTRQQEPHAQPLVSSRVQFDIVRVPGPKYVLVIETSARMVAVWQWVRKAIVNLLRYEIPDMSHVGIVTYNSGAAVTHGLTLVTGDMVTRQRLSDSVPDTGNKLATTELACVRCGVRTAMEQVLRSREDGGHVILVSMAGRDSVTSLDMDTLSEYIRYYNLRLSSMVLHTPGTPVSPHYTQLATVSGGVSRIVHVSPRVATMARVSSALMSAVTVDMGAGARVAETVLRVRGDHGAVRDSANSWTSQGQFVIDSLLGADTTFGILVSDDEEHHIKAITFTDEQGRVFGPFTKMSSMLDDINLKTINFPVGQRPPFDEDGYLGTVWRYSVSWYQDPAQLDNMILVRSKARDVTRQVSVSTWTSGDHVLSAQVRVGDQAVVGADLRLTLHMVDTNGQHKTSVANISLYDDGAADQSCCGSSINAAPTDHIGTFVRHVAGPVLNIEQHVSHVAPRPRRITDFSVEYLEKDHKVELAWSVPESLVEIESFTVSYSEDIDTVIRGDKTRDVVISRDPATSHGHVTRVLPGPDVSGMVYFVIFAVDSAGTAGRQSNIVYLNVTRDPGDVPGMLVSGGDTEEYNYTLLGVILGVITVFSLLTILVLSAWLHRRQRGSKAGKLRSLNGFSNKVSSGVNVVIDKSESRGLDTCVTHVPHQTVVASSVTPSATSFANNITPTYWSASQLLGDHEHRKSREPSAASSHLGSHHHHHGHHYHQYYPVHHQSAHYEDHDSDIIEDNNNEQNVSGESSSTLVMLNTSMSSSNTGSVRRQKNITQV